MVTVTLATLTLKESIDNLYKVCYPNFKDTTKYLG
jgi:hypothetical protein